MERGRQRRNFLSLILLNADCVRFLDRESGDFLPSYVTRVALDYVISLLPIAKRLQCFTSALG